MTRVRISELLRKTWPWGVTVSSGKGTCVTVVFWPLTQPKIPFHGDAPEGSDNILMAVMRGNRVSENWLTKWVEVKKFPWYTHRLTHRKGVTCKLHDSYFRLITIKHAISKIE